MEGRELGCKTLGCGFAALIIFATFSGMLATTQQAAQKLKARRSVRSGQTAAKNLQAVSRAVAAYENATGHLPPTESAKAFRAALVPQFLTNKNLLSDPATGEPFAPNPQVSKQKGDAVPKAYLLATGADIAGYHTVLFVSGQVRIVGSGEWKTLIAPMPSPAPSASPVTAPRTLPPAPAVPRARAPSPAQSPR